MRSKRGERQKRIISWEPSPAGEAKQSRHTARLPNTRGMVEALQAEAERLAGRPVRS
jgi:hypothetical protein